MKKIISTFFDSTILILAAVLIVVSFSSCTSTETYSLRNGIYTSKGDNMGPYVIFDTKAMTWRTGG